MKNIFIHVPKTGGSSFVQLLLTSLSADDGSVDKTHHVKSIKDINIRHLDFSHPFRVAECLDIFDKKNFELYSKSNIFTIVRNPIDRLVSEFIFQYYILGGGKNAAIISKLEPMPTRFLDYIKYPQVWDYQVAFLTGRGVADKNRPTDKDYQQLLNKMSALKINLGVTDEYQGFIELFENITGHQLQGNNVKIVKAAPPALKQGILASLTPEVKEYILEKNHLDYQLYQYAKSASMAKS
jgi:hypothetical protein